MIQLLFQTANCLFFFAVNRRVMGQVKRERHVERYQHISCKRVEQLRARGEGYHKSMFLPQDELEQPEEIDLSENKFIVLEPQPEKKKRVSDWFFYIHDRGTKQKALSYCSVVYDAMMDYCTAILLGRYG